MKQMKRGACRMGCRASAQLNELSQLGTLTLLPTSLQPTQMTPRLHEGACCDNVRPCSAHVSSTPCPHSTSRQQAT
eukprot:1159337-Pelagomonas_calceolata.AAC.3